MCFKCKLQFSKSWTIEDGLLFERSTINKSASGSTTPQKLVAANAYSHTFHEQFKISQMNQYYVFLERTKERACRFCSVCFILWMTSLRLSVEQEVMLCLY